MENASPPNINVGFPTLQNQMILLEIESALRKIAKACVAEGIKQEVVCMVLRNMMISEHNRLLYQAPGLTKKEGRPN